MAKKTKKAPPRPSGPPLRVSSPGVMRTDNPPPTKNPVVDRLEQDGEVFQLEYVRCGKAGCHCMSDASSGHGPYWYGYFVDVVSGKWRTRYVGITLKKKRQASLRLGARSRRASKKR